MAGQLWLTCIVTSLSSTMTSFVRLQVESVEPLRLMVGRHMSLQVCANGCLVLVAEAFVDILVHEGSLADSAAGSRKRDHRLNSS